MKNGIVQLAKMEELTMHKRLSEFGLLKSCFEMKNPRPSCARNVLFLDNDPFLDNSLNVLFLDNDPFLVNDPRLLDYNELQKKRIWIHSYNTME